MGILGFRYIDIVFTSKDPSTPFVLSRLAFSHTNTPQVLCPSLDNFPAVGENEHSYQLCGYGYQGYIERELRQVEHFKKLENKIIPESLDYNDINGLRKEATQKLSKFRPHSIGQASRISGVSPADISVLLVYLESLRRK